MVGLILLWLVVLVVSLVLLVKASGFFTNAAEKVGVYLHMPPFLIGVTLVAVGTSLPELASSLVAVFTGNSEIVVGNVVGSNIANIFLVLGITAVVVKHLKIGYELIHVDLPLFIGSALLLAVTVWDGVFTWHDGLLCLIGVGIYLRYTMVSERRSDPEIKKELKGELRREPLRLRTVFILLFSGFFIYVGAKFTIDAVVRLALLFGTGTEVIAVTAVALGTSLPELSVTLIAARQKKAEIAVGNILGSSIFNSLAVMGIPSLFGPLAVSPAILSFYLPMMLVASAMYLLVTQDKEITKWEGYFFLVFYAFFLGRTLGFF